MAQGNPNPNMSGLKPFQKGQSGNPSGLSAETQRLIRENAESALRIRAKMLELVASKIEGASEAEGLSLIESAMLKLLQDAETRGLGAPVQPVDHTTNGKDMPHSITRTIIDPSGNDGS